MSLYDIKFPHHANISSYAVHFGGARGEHDPAAVQSMLQSMEIYSSDGISMSLLVRQAGQEVAVDQQRAYFHLKEEEGKLILYVPKNKAKRQVCFANDLPAAVLKYFGARTGKAGKLGHVLIASSLSVVNDLLECDGIVEVPGVVAPDCDSGDESDSTEDVDTPARNSVTPLQSTPARSSVAPLQSTPSRDVAQLPLRQAASLSSPEVIHRIASEEVRVTQPPLMFTPSESLSPQQQVGHYERLLDVLIRQARQLATLPNAGRTIRSANVEDRELDILLAVESPYLGEKEFKIGAAGELFVCATRGGNGVPYRAC